MSIRYSRVVFLQLCVTMLSNSCILLCCVLIAVLGVEKYSSKYDNIDIQEILHNKRLLDSYANCILDRGKCTREGKELREILQEALETGCEKCTEPQVNGTVTAIDYIIKNELELWNEMTDKFDPKGIWRKKYEERARENGIIIPKD